MVIFAEDPFMGLSKEDTEPTDLDVWEFMVEYQGKNNMPPTLAEIAEGALTVEWRSSARLRVQRLLDAGWVEEVADEKQARRYRALSVPLKKTEDFDMVTTSRQFGGTISWKKVGEKS